VSSGPYWVTGPWPGRLALLARPRGGDWLDDEVKAWAQSGLDVILSLLSQDEAVELGLVREADVCRNYSLEFAAFPIPDRGVPVSRDATLVLVRRLEARVADGKAVGMHCRQGIGRSPLAAACLLVASGLTPVEAFERVARARGLSVPETTEQRAWVEVFARQLVAP
jgi:protein-tyrosine phosphatase